MKSFLYVVRLGLVGLIMISGFACSPVAKVDTGNSRPNILVIVADDMGFSDLGSFGGEIETPNLDGLANIGVRFSSFYTAPTCSPTRAMLLSGTDHHLVGLGSMAEALAPNQKGQPGYEGYLNFQTVTLAELLRDAGYRTYMAGKWHLGMEKKQGPAARGFEKSFVLLQAGGGHFDDLGFVPGKALYRENGEPVSLPEDFYSTKSYSDKMIQYIQENFNGVKEQDYKPFFGYLAYTAPHWPLQAPEASIEKYRGKYDLGYDELHDRRLAAVKALGIVPQHTEASPREQGEFPWDELSEDEKRVEARRMEIYAAMVDDIDVHVGRVLDTLKANGQLENTLIIFMSDNGAEGHELDRVWPAVGPWVEGCCDNSLANMGKADSYVWYGPNWARAGMTPFSRYKAYTNEGGIRAPAFISYPKVARKGTIVPNFVSVMDVMPTVLEFTGVEHPGPLYENRTVFPMQGTSMLSFLQGNAQYVHDAEEVMGWELFGKRAIRKGTWKIVYAGEADGNAIWELFNLESDPAEQLDLAAAQPIKLQQMIGFWGDYARENGVIIPNHVSGY